MQHRMTITLMGLMMTGLLAFPAQATDLNSFALVNIVEGITITETTALNFGDIALNDGTLTVKTDGTVTDPNLLSFGVASVSQGIFSLTVIAGSSYDISFTENVPAVGLTLNNFKMNIDGAADVVGSDSFVGVALPNQVSTMNVGADLSVNSATATLGNNQSIGYQVSVNFN